MATSLRALIIEDSQDDCDLLLGLLKRGGFEVRYEHVCSASDLTAALDR